MECGDLSPLLSNLMQHFTITRGAAIFLKCPTGYSKAATGRRTPYLNLQQVAPGGLVGQPLEGRSVPLQLPLVLCPSCSNVGVGLEIDNMPLATFDKREVNNAV